MLQNIKQYNNFHIFRNNKQVNIFLFLCAIFFLLLLLRCFICKKYSIIRNIGYGLTFVHINRYRGHALQPTDIYGICMLTNNILSCFYYHRPKSSWPNDSSAPGHQITGNELKKKVSGPSKQRWSTDTQYRLDRHSYIEYAFGAQFDINREFCLLSYWCTSSDQCFYEA